MARTFQSSYLATEMLLKPRYQENDVNTTSASIKPGAREQSSRLPQPTRTPSRKSPLKFFASSSTSKPNDPLHTQKEWQADFLNDLRFNRPARPSGSRPLPNRNATSSPVPLEDFPLRTSSAMSGLIPQADIVPSETHDRCSSAMSQRRVQSRLPSRYDGINNRGRALVPQPHVEKDLRNTSLTTKRSMIMPSATYRESGQRRMEKQEARSLREALEDMDIQDEERLHAAAQNEASELVWKHRNHNIPYRNPDTSYNDVSHLEKESHAGSQSMGQFVQFSSAGEIDHSVSSEHLGSAKNADSLVCNESPEEYGQVYEENAETSGTKSHALWDSPQKKAYMSMAISIPSKPSGHRQSGGPRARKVSGGLFRNPKDQIYEEPDEIEVKSKALKDPIPAPLQVKPRNSVSKLQGVSQPPSFRSETLPEDNNRKYSRFEIHRNPPSQSRNPSYLQNKLPPTPPDSTDASDSEVRSNHYSQKNGIEVRSDDIRAATSMRMKDRSPKLPSPTVVSDQRGRPIVSFEQGWKPKESNLGREQGSSNSSSSHGEPDRKPLKPHLADSTVSAPAIPTVNLPEPPTIHINDETLTSSETPAPTVIISSDLPSISVQETPNAVRPLPTPGSKPRFKSAIRPSSHHSSTDPTHSSTRHWSPSPSLHRATAQCFACALPIAGRIVSAASQRFHPHCFTCHYCSTLLEHVAFYPEPDASRAERLARIDARANGADLAEYEVEGKTADDDGDDGLRFYCHLDFHENFSPRCRSCKTPIEGEVIVACGGEWHVGHFFCAECGDPFDSKTPFVEKDGFAWCVGCHTKRFSGKCKGCRKPIVDLVVRALGGEWHEGCFHCKVNTSLYMKRGGVEFWTNYVSF